MKTASARPDSARRVGLIIPSVNAVIEPDCAAVAPPGLTFHATRVMLRETTPEGLRAMNEGVAAAAALIASVSPEVVAFACTSGSFIDGEAGLARQIETIGSVTGCPVVATSRAIIEACSALGLRRVALATPYLDVINEAESRFLLSHGIEVTAVRGLGLSGKAIREVSPAEVAALVRATNTPDSEAVFVSCTDFRALEVAGALEAELGKPVLTSNQVTLWGIFRALDIAPQLQGYGRLLA
ncbi:MULTISPECIES: aspartate/glutamate racemase family protein [unclassified Chelatococcus]|uniref:maleate cis-trans isomerase family protein n=1 Tax=unclassified Chelatococcus TaxID=2638111 RepID=UPI001BCBC360|nr:MULTISPECIES: aspartate/glutamate racemase family protein [unclassified Chelatococcus]MBS7700827.1 aspartate/glutamate racemase family protein [Chelatococcus sp. YT9]MBX3555360.1 aspartate/glutamate racemase family protein [Chelatococcus sp.]